MELTWLEDLLALAERRNFSRAAMARNVTQPAFSRRIQALEQWVGVPLVVRAPQGLSLTAAGEVVHAQAAGLTRDLHQMRRDALKAAGREGTALAIAATHALSFTFFPGWIRSMADLGSLGTLSLMSDTMAACERILLAGDADFLLCHTRPGVPTGLTPGAFDSRVVGTDRLVPVCAPDATGTPRWTLPGEAAVPLLAYSEASGLARILTATHGDLLALAPVFAAPLAATLQTMARQGQGLAWLPASLVVDDLAAGRLVDAGADAFAIEVEIRLFRPTRHRSATAEAFWAAL
ncbi:LysR substrate-binding domain-containing protein [Nitrospirillum sp. BR 11163]|uniref:LysR substrate-binding domain-containing protein n=1 Tax=Nitrospirillum sp. BR 11163 TaxID=3104323 RepID=UPI002AFF504F|nr:LysR substrate-binding domain-containing protein [Nitrospirillum sp. BR 11163]MEA1676618.1 LysR substrate-binding domain-containing protein [Nitrospirillum sp. BR 11163]